MFYECDGGYNAQAAACKIQAIHGLRFVHQELKWCELFYPGIMTPAEWAYFSFFSQDIHSLAAKWAQVVHNKGTYILG